MSVLEFPVFVHEKDDDSVMEFPNLAAMQGYLEAIDVENGEYEAWDARGRCLELSVGSPKSEWLKMILTGEKASEEDFAALRARAERRTEDVPFLKRLAQRVRRS